MTMEMRRWRFFTRLDVCDCAVKQIWCWEELDSGHRVVSSAAGFTTLPAAMRDARRNGFDGNEDPVDGEPRYRRLDDWATGEDVLDKPFGWLNTGRGVSERPADDAAQAGPGRGDNPSGTTLRVR
ncbi:MAG: hypothetical protein JWM26_402 [Betaproteobacteria bacterium]|nr:hypothetical protein [Betaproteobacteria bacterium]